MEEFKEKVKEMVYVELRRALTTNKHLYSEEQINIIQKEWLSRGFSLNSKGEPEWEWNTSKTATKSNTTIALGDLYIKDATVITKVHNFLSTTIKILIVLGMLISFIVLCTSCETNKYDDLEINWSVARAALISFLLIPCAGLITLWFYNIIFGFFYDVRKMRMMMEEKNDT